MASGMFCEPWTLILLYTLLIQKIASRVDLNQCITDLGFVDYFTADGMQRFTGGGYEVEFIGQRAGGRDKGFLSVPEWHLTAMPLPFINILIDYSTTSMLCGFSIRFPVPEAFFLHKLITAQKRLSDNKRMKDIEQCSVIAKIINDDRLQQIIHNQRFSKATKKYIALSCAAIEFPLHRIGM